MKTVREVAKELKVSRQAIYSKLTDKFKEDFTSIESINNRDTLVITKPGIERLRQEIVKVDSKVDSLLDNENDSKIIELLNRNIEVLQEQLIIKDNQITELNERLKEQQELNKNSQVLLLNEQKRNKMIELESQDLKENNDKTLLNKIKGLFK